MKILCVYRHKAVKESSEVKKIIELLKEKGDEIIEFDLFLAQSDNDYDRLIDLIWEADKTISWW
ncbi:MAG: hypothetical protein NZ530_01240 [Thermodesulfobacteriaceae bacterium]|nr:hypothetical protein [Thermodesulfobacteriaceae bacterium]MCX8041035.1 hypothetical protein [Thermodesulfobacteriaceae bacterium]MDW8135274.1 hypothetical protein [Thermodesulfobacterium sp.]